MGALEKLFPNATARPWLAQRDLQRQMNGEEGIAVAYLVEPGVTRPVAECFTSHDTKLIVHVVNTYDARDEALREALVACRIAEQDICKMWPVGLQAGLTLGTLRRTIAKIEAALTAKSGA